MVTFDYIIVGAGSAGCVLANRLTEDPQTSVLLLEAGGSDDLPAIYIPARTPALFHSAVDWSYFTQEESYLHNRTLFWPRGKVLGGSSSTNFQIYMRGNQHDYDQWQALGNDGWNFADVLPYFKKSEDQERGVSDYHGKGGPLHVTDRSYTNPLSLAFIEAGVELGLPRNDDFNGASQEGVGSFQVTQYQGKRWSTADGYLRPAQHRPNLTLQTEVLVTRILFEGTQAVGIAYLKDGQEQQEQVNKEVILSAGSVNSPQILMLSGLGPANQLRKLGLQVIVDLPGVGHNLQDHLNVPVYTTSKQPISLANIGAEENYQEYKDHQSGPFTSNLAEVGAFMKTQSDLTEPDIQLHFLPRSRPDLKVHGCTFRPTLLHSSQGYITLRTADPTQPPAIYANYLSSNTDIAVLVQGVKLVRRFNQSKAFVSIYEDEVNPGPQVQSDEEIAEYVRNNADTMYHPVGTCKMGSDAMAVVDEQLRVRGVEGLRVVDASIMPIIPHGNTNAPTIMIAEKAADMIAHNVVQR